MLRHCSIRTVGLFEGDIKYNDKDEAGKERKGTFTRSLKENIYSQGEPNTENKLSATT